MATLNVTASRDAEVSTWTLANAGIKDPASELVMISGSGASPDKAAMRSAVSAVLAAVQATGQVGGVRAPVTSASGRQVLLQFAMKGDPDTASARVQPVEDAVTRVQAAHRDVTIEEVGQASVIRAMLLPSVMVLLGDRNWYLPRWLGRFTAGGAGRRPPLAGHPGRVEPGLQRVPSPSLEDP